MNIDLGSLRFLTTNCIEILTERDKITMVIVSGQVFSVNKEVMVLVEFPELAVDHVEVLVAEEVRNLIDVLLLKQGKTRPV